MCSWATTDADVDALLADMRQLAGSVDRPAGLSPMQP
jgi:hypothetical protein